MRLFDNVLEEYNAVQPFTHAEGFAGVLFAAIACDEHFAEAEVSGLWTFLKRMKLYNHWNEQEFESLMHKLYSVYKREGVDVLLERSAAAMPLELAETAFAGACDLILADGVADPREQEFLNALIKRLGIDGDKGLMLAEAMAIKNRG